MTSLAPLARLAAELERLDVLLRAHLTRARADGERLDPFQGLYITDEQIGAWMTDPIGLPSWARQTADDGVHEAVEAGRAQIVERTLDAMTRGVSLRLVELARVFELTNFDLDAILLCLAPELNLRYERLYAIATDRRRHTALRTHALSIVPADMPSAWRERFVRLFKTLRRRRTLSDQPFAIAVAAPVSLAGPRWKSGSAATRHPMDPGKLRQELVRLAARSGKTRVVVHLNGPPDAATRTSLQAAGVRLLGYLGNFSYFANLTGDLDADRVVVFFRFVAI